MAATQVEHGRVRWLPSLRSTAPPAQAPSVRGKVRARRRQIFSLRRDLVLSDAALTLGIVIFGLATGREAAAGMALAVSVAAIAHVCAADSPRSIIAVRSVVKLAVVVSGIGCAVIVVLGSGSSGRALLLGSACVSLALVAARLLVRLPGLAPRYGLGQRRSLLVGDPRALEGTTARRVSAEGSGDEILVITRAEDTGTNTQPSGQVLRAHSAGEDQRTERHQSNGPSGVVERVLRTALDSGAELVTVVPGDSWGQQQLRELSWALEGTGIDMVISTNLDGIAPHRVDVTQRYGRLMIKVGSASPRGIQALLKKTLDRLGAAFLLIVSAPVLVLIAAAVRVESRGPAVFRQTRVREGGVRFTMYKFRTMRVDAEQQLSELQELNMHGAERPLFKMENDPRITRVGHVLRKTSLDELPQLLNVLKGQMSLIGPRPALPLEVEMYDYVARRRLAVKPGMTGLWQVSGRSRLTWDESIRYDLDYVDNWSPATDAAIAVRTIRAVVSKDGAF